MSDATGLLLEDSVGLLSEAALALSNAGHAVSYAADLDEARLIAADLANALQVVVFPPTLSDRALSTVIGVCASAPRMIAYGDDPGVDCRHRLYEAGVSWGIWGPDRLRRLDTAISAAFDMDTILPTGSAFREAEIPAVLCARAASMRSPGVLRLLSYEGGFIETSLPAGIGQSISIDLELAERGISLAGRVRSRFTRGSDASERWPSGLLLAFEKSGGKRDRFVREFIDDDQDSFRMV